MKFYFAYFCVFRGFKLILHIKTFFGFVEHILRNAGENRFLKCKKYTCYRSVDERLQQPIRKGYNLQVQNTFFFLKQNFKDLEFRV